MSIYIWQAAIKQLHSRVMKSIVLFFLAFFTAPALAAYSAAIEDLPLMERMTEQAEPVVFDTPAGRVVETGADISARAQVVQDFYATALPPLGWRNLGAGVFARGDEVLKIETETANGQTTVRFTLSPKG